MFNLASMFNSLLNNCGEVPIAGAPPAPAPAGPAPQPTPQPSAYDTFIQKKGFKSNDEVARSYQEIEQGFSKVNTARDITKRQLEQHGYSLDDDGNIIQVNPGVQPPAPQYGQPQPTQDTIYDPYTGQPISDPIDRQLAMMPLGQRTAVLFNAMMNQRDQMTVTVNKVASEILSSPEAKGFEDDVRNVMQQLPLEQRVRKESWQDALLKVKGMKYDEALKNAGAQGVESFLNKNKNQPLPSAPGAGDNVKLTEEQENTFKWYQANKPGMFKDKAHFLRSLSPTMGR